MIGRCWSLALCLSLACVASANLYDHLQEVQFRNDGFTRADDEFAFMGPLEACGTGQKVIYLEADNVSCTQCVWSDEGRYKTPHMYLFKRRAAGAPARDASKQCVYDGDAPASGMRSAVPLGGVSAGSFELRGDGTLHEWTIHNAGPSGAAKIQQYPDAHFAAAVDGEARVLQTHPQLANSDAAGTGSAVASAGVAALRYRGTHPVSRLDVLDDSFAPGAALTLFGFSAFKVSDRNASARPAAAFTLAVSNARAQAANATFMMQLPHAVEVDQARRGSAISAHPTPAGLRGSAAAASCLQACAAQPACASWMLEAGQCTLQHDAPLNAYARGVTSGIKSVWRLADSAMSGGGPSGGGPSGGGPSGSGGQPGPSQPSPQCLELVRQGSGPMHGVLSLCAAAEGGLGDPVWGWTTSDDPAQAFRELAAGAADARATATAPPSP
eukprot:g6421.t1